MKLNYFNYGCIAACALSVTCSVKAADYILEVKLESMAAHPDDPSQWVSYSHPVKGFAEGESEVKGGFTSTYAVGKGLWFGMYAENFETGGYDLVDSRVTGAKPVVDVVFTSRDTNADPLSPRTRADIPYGVTVTVSNISDDTLLDHLENGEEFLISTKRVMIETHTADSDGLEQDNGVADVYTTDPGVIELTQGDNSVGTYAATDVFTHLSSTEGEGNYFKNGTETVNAYVMGSEDVNNPAWTFTSKGSIRVLPTADATDIVDESENSLDGKTLTATPNKIVVTALQLYPDSKTKMGIYVNGELAVETEEHSVDIQNDVENYTFIMNRSEYAEHIKNDGDKCRVELKTTTVFDDTDGDGVTEWVVLKSAEFDFDREVKVNSTLVSGE